jgi:hypothetical protein
MKKAGVTTGGILRRTRLFFPRAALVREITFAINIFYCYTIVYPLEISMPSP